MSNKELMSQYVFLRQRLERLYQECESVEAEIREVERELELGDVQLPSMGQDEALIDHPISDRPTSPPR